MTKPELHLGMEKKLLFWGALRRMVRSLIQKLQLQLTKRFRYHQLYA